MMESYLSDAEREVLTKKCLPTSSEIKAFKDSKLKLLEYLWTVKEVDTKGPNEANFRKCYNIVCSYSAFLLFYYTRTCKDSKITILNQKSNENANCDCQSSTFNLYK